MAPRIPCFQRLCKTVVGSGVRARLRPICDYHPTRQSFVRGACDFTFACLPDVLAGSKLVTSADQLVSCWSLCRIQRMGAPTCAVLRQGSAADQHLTQCNACTNDESCEAPMQPVHVLRSARF